MSKETVLIVGGGFSGAMVAAQLARDPAPPQVQIVDSHGSRGRGIAYATPTSRHLLNVPACSMSAFPDEPLHFLEWARQRDPAVRPDDYLPRTLYGDYLEEISASLPCQRLQGEVVDLWVEGERVVALDSTGRRLEADRAVLAIGNFPPAPLPIPASPDYFPNPWDCRWRENLDEVESILLVGTGLTAADVVVELVGAGYAGTIHALSKHGHLPNVHISGEPSHGTSPLVTEPDTLAGKTRRLRQLCRDGRPWQAAMDDLRQHVPELWKALSFEEQRTFARHLRAYWDVHRHRVAPSIGATLERARQSGQLKILAGRLLNAVPSPAGHAFTVGYKPRGESQPRSLTVDRVVNCTGPQTRVTDIPSPVLQKLLERGLAVPDRHQSGLCCDEAGALTQPDGHPSARLFTLGAMRRGELWESIAVRELRQQAADVARAILRGSREAQEFSGGVANDGPCSLVGPVSASCSGP